MPEILIKLLFIYGPFALLWFVVIICERKAQKQRPNGKRGEAIYVAVWVVTFILIFVDVWAWVRMHEEEARIVGRATGLQSTWSITSPFDHMFIRRILEGQTDSDFEWRIYSQSPLREDTPVNILLDRSILDHERLSRYEMPIKDEFYASDMIVRLKYLPQSRILQLIYGRNMIDLHEALASESMIPDSWHLPSFSYAVHAQDQLSQDQLSLDKSREMISDELQSPDVLVRLKARSDLGLMDDLALPYIQGVLSKPNSSYFLRLGVIAALNRVPSRTGKALIKAPCKIIHAAQEDDPALRTEAIRYLKQRDVVAPGEGCPLPLKGHTNSVNGVAWSPDGKWLATASSDGTIKIWDANSGTVSKTLPGHTTPGRGKGVEAVAWSPDGKLLASANDDFTATIYDVFSDSDKPVKTFKDHTNRVEGVAWSPDGKWLATASDDFTAKIWDANSEKVSKTFRGHMDKLKSVAWSPNGKLLAAAGDDSKTTIWDVSSSDDRPLKTLPQSLKTEKITSLAWSQRNGRIATGTRRGTATVWVIGEADKKPTASFNINAGGAIQGIAWSQVGDSHRLATGSSDGKVKVWSTKNGNLILTLQEHCDYYFPCGIKSVAWSPDGKWLATGSSDRMAKIWFMGSGN